METPPTIVQGKDVFAMSTVPDKNALLYDFTGTWCPYCTDGIATVQDILANHNNVIAVAVHSGGYLGVTDGEPILSAYVSGYPSGSADLFKPPAEEVATSGRPAWEGRVLDRLDDIVPATVSLPVTGWNASTREIDVTVSAEFFAPVTEDMRLNVYVIEDHVIADQANGYNGNSNHPFYNMGNPIVGYSHDHVLRAILGGAWGEPGTVPMSVNVGEVHSHSFTYTLPQNYDENNIKLIGLIQRYDDNDIENRQVFNAVEKHLPLWPTAIDPSIPSLQAFDAYPNPFADRIRLNLSLETTTELTLVITDMTGREVATLTDGSLPAGDHSFYWNGQSQAGVSVANGMYIAEVRSSRGDCHPKDIVKPLMPISNRAKARPFGRAFFITDFPHIRIRCLHPGRHPRW